MSAREATVFKKVLLGFVAVIALLVAVGAALPRQWKVVRSVDIAAPPAAIHPLIDDLRRWPEWAAWNKQMDPEVVWTYSGPARGVGAAWAWNGPQMGRGKMTITRSDPELGVWIDECIEGDEVNAQGFLEFAHVDGKTRVTWSDTGTLPPVIGGYLVGLINDMLAGHFEVGLQGLKALAERGAAEKK